MHFTFINAFNPHHNIKIYEGATNWLKRLVQKPQNY